MKIVIFGSNECSLLAKFYFEKQGDSVVAFCEDKKFIKKKFKEKIPIIPFEKIEKYFSKKDHVFFAPLYDNKLREIKSKQIENKGYKLISYISDKALVYTNKIGKNCFIFENNVIQPYVKIGNNVIMWSGNHIGHHSKIEDNNFFSSHVVLSGRCKVKKYCWFGVNSTIRDGITIAEGSFVCMGAKVIKNTQPYSKNY